MILILDLYSCLRFNLPLNLISRETPTSHQDKNTFSQHFFQMDTIIYWASRRRRSWRTRTRPTNWDCRRATRRSRYRTRKRNESNIHERYSQLECGRNSIFNIEANALLNTGLVFLLASQVAKQKISWKSLFLRSNFVQKKKWSHTNMSWWNRCTVYRPRSEVFFHNFELSSHQRA